MRPAWMGVQHAAATGVQAGKHAGRAPSSWCHTPLPCPSAATPPFQLPVSHLIPEFTAAPPFCAPPPHTHTLPLLLLQLDFTAGREPAVNPDAPPPRGSLQGRGQAEALLLKYLVGMLQVGRGHPPGGGGGWTGVQCMRSTSLGACMHSCSCCVCVRLRVHVCACACTYAGGGCGGGQDKPAACSVTWVAAVACAGGPGGPAEGVVQQQRQQRPRARSAAEQPAVAPAAGGQGLAGRGSASAAGCCVPRLGHATVLHAMGPWPHSLRWRVLPSSYHD